MGVFTFKICCTFRGMRQHTKKRLKKIVDWVALEAPSSKEEASRLVRELVGWQIVAGALIKNFHSLF
jgi:hypothetical protein